MNIVFLKLISAISGFFLFVFLILHALGNLKYFQGQEKFDSYAIFLRSFGEEFLGHATALWIFRLSLMAAFVTHIFSTIILWRINSKARPSYEGQIWYRSATVSSRYMVFLGLVVFAFVVFHLLHLTFGFIHPPGFEHLKVFNNVTISFSQLTYLIIYLIGVTAATFHVSHGFWSAFASLGASYNIVLSARKVARYAALVIWLMFMSVPFYIYLFKS
ncbi:MAG: succinate dehydrogenase cytochrome b subunit [Deltaproteobacteria bacterium]|nr:succinate dehydrogenase cytochrome b subunit [Deltaproteobacteria bacterium]MCX7952975.1 succinate dehydrogenase cytochrome b subunit [Deltaproteobacteria bacterium]